MIKLDEISLSAPTTVCAFGGGTYRTVRSRRSSSA